MMKWILFILGALAGLLVVYSIYGTEQQVLILILRKWGLYL